jgi:hypothetical protein
VAVVALTAYIAVAQRMVWLALAVITYQAFELGVFNSLSQREHLLGALTGALAGLGARLVVGSREPRPSGSCRPTPPTPRPADGN